MNNNDIKLFWCDVLHMYQPPTQSKEVLKLVTEESYSLILDLLEKNKNLKITVNIPCSLLELLDQNGHLKIIQKIKEFWEKGKIELLGSAAYHPLLPLLNKEEIIRQINLNNECLKKYFGINCKPKGFFLPEMAYSFETADIISKAGFDYIFLDPIHCPELSINPSTRYTVKNTKLRVVFRDSLFSRSFPPEFISQKRDFLKSEFLITVHDAELYGHWHKDDMGFYKKIYSDETIISITIQEYLDKLEAKNSDILEIVPREASWESKKNELDSHIPFFLWSNPTNFIHTKLSELKEETYSLLEANKQDKNYEIAKNFWDKGVSSCAWWWASEEKLSEISPESWNPTEIEKGAKELVTSMRALKSIPEHDRINIERLFSDLVLLIWSRHWEKENEKR